MDTALDTPEHILARAEEDILGMYAEGGRRITWDLILCFQIWERMYDVAVERCSR